MDPKIDFSYRSADDIQKELDERKSKRAKTHNFDFVKDGLDTQDIRNTVNNIRKYIDENKDNISYDKMLSRLNKDHEFFAQRYPMLFSMVTKQEGFDFSSLEYFLSMRDRIISKELTADEASKKVGEDWFNKYVDVSNIKKE